MYERIKTRTGGKRNRGEKLGDEMGEMEKLKLSRNNSRYIATLDYIKQH